LCWPSRWIPTALIALEEDRLDTAPGVRALLARHHAGEVVVRIVATTATKRQLDGTYLPNFGIFLSRLAAVGLGHLPILKPPAAFDLTYFDWCVLPETTTKKRAAASTKRCSHPLTTTWKRCPPAFKAKTAPGPNTNGATAAWTAWAYRRTSTPEPTYS
jgi:hypothetical protein